MTPRICECCGQALPRDFLLVDSEILLRGNQRVIWEAVLKAGKYGIDRDRLFQLLYGHDPDGGPESRNILAVTVSVINRKIKKLGKRIEAPRGPGESTYTLRDVT